MRLLDVGNLEDAKQFLRENKIVHCEDLHVLVLIVGEEHREEIESLCDELGIELEGEEGV